MRFDGVSTLNQSRLLLESTRQTDRRLAEVQVEIATGRHHDIGLELGASVSRSLDLRSLLTEEEGLVASGKLALIKADVTQSSLGSLTAIAKSLLETLTAARGAGNGQAIARSAAEAALASVIEAVNVTYDGQHLFGGTNTAVAPLAAYAASAGEAAVDGAFLAHFGFSQDDPLASSITPAGMQAFLAGGYADLFASPGWTDFWSQAADQNLAQRISPSSTVDIATNANVPGVRMLVEAMVSLFDLGQASLNDPASDAVIANAISLIASAQGELADQQTRLGMSQQRLSLAMEAAERRGAALNKAIVALETVNPYESATRANMLMTQLETSYALTSRIKQLSLLKYI